MKNVVLQSVARVRRFSQFIPVVFLCLVSIQAAWAQDPTEVVILSTEHSAFTGDTGSGRKVEAWSRTLEAELQKFRGHGTVTFVMPLPLRYQQDPALLATLHDEGTAVSVGLDFNSAGEATRTETFRAFSTWSGKVKVIFLRGSESATGVPGAFDAFPKAASLFVYRELPRTEMVVLNNWQVAVGGYFIKHPRLLGVEGRQPLRTFAVSHDFNDRGTADASVIEKLGLDRAHFNGEGFEFGGRVNALRMLYKSGDLQGTLSLYHVRDALKPEIRLGARAPRVFYRYPRPGGDGRYVHEDMLEKHESAPTVCDAAFSGAPLDIPSTEDGESAAEDGF